MNDFKGTSLREVSSRLDVESIDGRFQMRVKGKGRIVRVCVCKAGNM
jgi:hypothetical protein